LGGGGGGGLEWRQCQIGRGDSLEGLSGHRRYLPLSVVEPEPPSPTCGSQTSLQLVTDSSWNWAGEQPLRGAQGTVNTATSYRTAFVVSCLVKRRFIDCMGKILSPVEGWLRDRQWFFSFLFCRFLVRISFSS